MNQSVTLFSDDFNSISKPQLIKIFEIIDTCSTEFFEQNSSTCIEVDYSAGNSTSLSLKEFKSNFSSKEDFCAISLVCNFRNENYISFYVSKNTLTPGYSYHIAVTCNNRTRIEVQEFTETVSKRINNLLQYPIDSFTNQMAQGKTNGKNIDENRKTKREQISEVLKLTGKIIGFLASVATIISLIYAFIS